MGVFYQIWVKNTNFLGGNGGVNSAVFSRNFTKICWFFWCRKYFPPFLCKIAKAGMRVIFGQSVFLCQFDTRKIVENFFEIFYKRVLTIDFFMLKYYNAYTRTSMGIFCAFLRTPPSKCTKSTYKNRGISPTSSRGRIIWRNFPRWTNGHRKTWPVKIQEWSVSIYEA